jgi:hypothetical protein
MAASAFSAEAARISPAGRDATGALVFTVDSEYQSQATKIKVLLPDVLKDGKRYSVLYVLPVEPLDQGRWGDSLAEVKKYDLANKYGLICVLPTFAALPWYADHPTDAKLRQESYFLKVVVPFIDRTYPTLAAADGRLLVGFSKSGWGAFSLLLRHPEMFAKAAAWDAPLMEQHPNKYGMGPIFATQENFEKYQISKLLKQEAGRLSGPPRLIHLGYGNFRDQHQSAHQLMDELKIAQVYRDGPKREHSWNSGWLAEAVQMLVEEPNK